MRVDLIEQLLAKAEELDLTCAEQRAVAERLIKAANAKVSIRFVYCVPNGTEILPDLIKERVREICGLELDGMLFAVSELKSDYSEALEHVRTNPFMRLPNVSELMQMYRYKDLINDALRRLLFAGKPISLLGSWYYLSSEVENGQPVVMNMDDGQTTLQSADTKFYARYMLVM